MNSTTHPATPNPTKTRSAFYVERMGFMGRPSKYAPEVREVAVRMVLAHQGEYKSQWAGTCSIASKFGCSAETLRKWVPQFERDHLASVV